VRVPPTRSPAARAVAWTLAVAAAFAFAVFVSGPLHRAIEASGAKDWPFARTFRYLLMLAVLAALFAGLRPWRVVPPDLYGLRGPRARPWLALAGAGLAVAVLLADVLAQAGAGWIGWDPDAGGKFWKRLPASLAAGVGIGLLEEVFFRGWAFERLSRGRSAFRAAVWLSVVFALPHAFQGSRAPKDLVAGPAGALDALAAWGGHVLDPAGFLPRFVGLSLLSLVLVSAYLRTGTLWIAVGVHGGAHVFLQQYSALTTRDPETWNWAGSKWLYDGVPAWILMIGLARAFWPRPLEGRSERHASGRAEPFS
jgi:membrane protease YdiL (CAAX protease family)